MPKKARRARQAASAAAKRAGNAVEETGRGIPKAAARVGKAAAGAGKRARDAVSKTGEKVTNSPSARMMVAAALGAAAARAAVEIAQRSRHSETSKEPDGSAQPEMREPNAESGQDDGGGFRGLFHRAFETLSDVAAHVTSALTPGDDGEGEASDDSEPKLSAQADDALTTTGGRPPDIKRVKRATRAAYEEFDATWVA